MKKRKKGNIRLQNTIFIICLIFVGVILFIYKSDLKELLFKDKDVNNVNDNKNNNINNNNKDENDNEDKDIYKDYKKALGFKLENLNRYIAYKENHPDLDYDTIVSYVNIGLDYNFYSYINDADISLDEKILVNKYLKLPGEYEPSDLEEIDSKYFINGNLYVRNLREDAKEAFEEMSQASIDNGTPVYGQSGYRHYGMQESLYNSAVESMGVDAADNDTARPGHSEHQTGLAIDVSSTKGGNMLSFEYSDSYSWMKENAYKYGFILRYTKKQEYIHGYINEPWHYRYVGIDIATDIHNNYPDLTYEEYFYKFIDK